MKKKLKFAPIIRVSTEKQAERGESLNTQKKQIIAAVESLGGIIPEYCWKYSGQEHATPAQERKKLKQLLADSGKGVFDAVIVCDPSRWSRDNLDSEKGLLLLQENGIKFFILQSEYDLYSPQHRLFLGMSTQISQFQAMEQTRKSLLNRIERARRNVPTCGKLPYGRNFNKKTEVWSVDHEKQEKIKVAADLYLKGGQLPIIAKELGFDHSTLHKILTKRSGDIWPQRFRSPGLNIDETVQTKIPPLLPELTISKIFERVEANKTYAHGMIKREYLLARMIFCDNCGYTLFGQTNHSGKRYYRHQRRGKKPCDHNGGYLPAEMIENAVMVHLFSILFDPVGLEKAVKQAIPDSSELDALAKQKKVYEAELEKLSLKKKRLLKAVQEGNLEGFDIKEEMDNLKSREGDLNNKTATICVKLENRPTSKQVKAVGSAIRKKLAGEKSAIKKRVIESYHQSLNRFYEMSFSDKRQLLQHFFAGKDHEGRRLGVYLQKDKNGNWRFIIRGIFGSMQDRLPMTSEMARSMLGIEDDKMDPFTGEVLDSSGQCHAHNSLGIHK